MWDLIITAIVVWVLGGMLIGACIAIGEWLRGE